MTRTALAILSTLFLAASAQAEVYPDIVDFQFIGASFTFVAGDGGVLDMSRACQETWPQARMCTSEEVMETVTMPAGHQDDAWVRPVFQPIGHGAATTLILDASGMGREASGAGIDDISCDAWGGSSSLGLTVSPAGSFSRLLCEVERPVACCALIPVPEAPTLLMDAAGAAGFAALAMSKRAKVRNQAFGAVAAVVAVSAGFAFARVRSRHAAPHQH